MISILTDPPKPARYAIRFRRLFQPSNQPRYGGHYAVTRSAVEGLRKCGCVFNYNPVSDDAVHDKVVVLSGIKALERALKLKRSGKIHKLIAGPNLVVFPNDNNGIVASPDIDALALPSLWTKEVYERVAPSLHNRIKIWWAGVNTDYWHPEHNKVRKNVLVYDKLPTSSSYLAQAVKRVIVSAGYNCDVVSYGKYSPRQFKKVLAGSKAMVVLGSSESQGIAHAEAWAMDVPTLVWHSGFLPFMEYSHHVHPSPCLTSATGLIWSDIGELECMLSNLKSFKFYPRQWVLQHMSDQKIAERLIDICQ